MSSAAATFHGRQHGASALAENSLLSTTTNWANYVRWMRAFLFCIYRPQVVAYLKFLNRMKASWLQLSLRIASQMIVFRLRIHCVNTCSSIKCGFAGEACINSRYRRLGAHLRVAFLNILRLQSLLTYLDALMMQSQTSWVVWWSRCK